MDNYRHTDENQEFDDISQLILELKGLSDDDQNTDRNQTSPDPVEPDAPKKKVSKKSGLLPLWKVALIDILVGGVVILAFALGHHVIPAMLSAKTREEAMLQATEAPIVATQPAAPMEAPVEEVTEAPTEPDTRTEWQKKFEEHFSDEIIRTENSYKSPNVSITLETIT